MKLDTAKKIYKAIQRFRGEPVFDRLEYLEKSQWLSSEEIETLQIEKLRKILIYSLENVPYYQNSLKPFSNIIYNISSLSQLSHLPLLTKREIQENFNSLQSINYRGKTSIESTSGSTGDPSKFKLDRNASAFIRALSYREHLWYGIDIGAKEARFYGIPMDFVSYRKEQIKDFLMNRKRFTVYNLSEETLYGYYKFINEYQPDYIYGYASAVFEFVRFLKMREIRFLKPFLKAIIVTSEVLYQDDRRLMESWLKVPVVNEYGTSELGIIASQCPHGNMHISSENVIVETIKKGQPVEKGEKGEIILTGLNNYAMPLIRYEVGDVACLAQNSCKCRRGLPLLGQIEGRVNNMVVTPEGKISSGFVFYYISRSLIEKDAGIKKFKVIQNSINDITFQIVKGSNFRDKSLVILKKKTHDYLSPNIKVNFEFCDYIPHTSSGKIIHFISNIGSPFKNSQKQ